MLKPGKSLQAVLDRFGLTLGDLLGQGGEAAVFALGSNQVLRVLAEGTGPALLLERQALVDELGSKGAPFLLPEMSDLGEVGGRWYALERRLRGGPVADVLGTLERGQRDLLVERYMSATAALGDLYLAPRPYWGELIGPGPLRRPTWRGFLRERAARNLEAAGCLRFERGALERFAGELADDLPTPEGAAFVHLDAFAGNVLAVGTEVTAVIDISVMALAGDRRLDPLSAAVYLGSTQITPTATQRDLAVAQSWLRAAGLQHWFGAARDWLAAYWHFAVDDKKLHEWCHLVLEHRLGPSLNRPSTSSSRLSGTRGRLSP